MPAVYSSLGGRLVAVKVVFALIVVVAALALAGDYFWFTVVTDDGAGASARQAGDLAQTVSGLLENAALLAGAVAFILWLTRAYRNVDAVAPGARRYEHVWAWLGWFVPIFGYFRPVQVVNDVRHAAGGGLGGLVGIWWTVWLFERMWWLIARLGSINAEETGTLPGQALMEMVDDVLWGTAALLALLVAAGLTRRLEAQAVRPA